MNKKIKIGIIIMVSIILIIGGYIVYNKFFNLDSNNNVENKIYLYDEEYICVKDKKELPEYVLSESYHFTYDSVAQKVVNYYLQFSYKFNDVDEYKKFDYKEMYGNIESVMQPYDVVEDFKNLVKNYKFSILFSKSVNDDINTIIANVEKNEFKCSKK